MAATVFVVILRFGDRVVYVDGRNLQLTGLRHFQQPVHAGRGFLADAMDMVQHLRVLLVDHGRQVTAIIQEHGGIPGFAVLQDCLFDTPLALCDRLALPGINGGTAGGHGGGGVILGREDVARGPADFGAQFHQCLYQHGGLDGHVNTTENAGTSQRLAGAVFLAQGHQGRHFGFGQGHLPATEIGQTDIRDLVVCYLGIVRHCFFSRIDQVFFTH